MKFILCGDSWLNIYYEHDLLLKSKGLSSHTVIYNEGESSRFKFYEFFLQGLGHEVVNLSVPGTSNRENVRALSQCEHTDADFVIWIHTHPTRDFVDWNGNNYVKIENREDIDRIHSLRTAKDIEDLAYECTADTINSLRELSKTKFKNTHFLCVGGCGYLEDTHFTDQDKQVHHVLSSIMELVFLKSHPKLLFASWNKLAEYFENQELVDELLELTDEIQQVYRSVILTPAWPDPTGHPNAGVVVKVIDEIFNYIETNQLTPLGSTGSSNSGST